MIQIVDVSANNAQPDWKSILGAGYSVAIVKASEGVDYEDPKCKLYCAQARDAGFKIGTYHYLRIRHNREQDARTQARQYATIWMRESCDLRPIIDVESGGNQASTTAEWSDAVLSFVDAVESMVGFSPIIYTSPGEWSGAGLGGLKSLARCPLWLAAYTSASTVKPPEPWTQYAMWQYDGNGRIAGAGPYDLSRADDLRDLLA
jgi:lysozyme